MNHTYKILKYLYNNNDGKEHPIQSASEFQFAKTFSFYSSETSLISISITVHNGKGGVFRVCQSLWHLIQHQITSSQRSGSYDKWWASSLPPEPQKLQLWGLVNLPSLSAFLTASCAIAWIYSLLSHICLLIKNNCHSKFDRCVGFFNPGQSHLGHLPS